MKMYRQQLTTLIFITIFTVSVNCFAIQYANKAANEFTPIPVTDPLVIDDVQFVINQINSLSSSKYLVKSIRIKKAFILLKEYVRLTFDLAATKCAKDSQSPLDKCPIDKTKPITTCAEVIVDNTPWREVKKKITNFGNCKP